MAGPTIVAAAAATSANVADATGSAPFRRFVITFVISKTLPDSLLQPFLTKFGAYRFVAFDVDPGRPGGNTSIHATYYTLAGAPGAVAAVEQFT